MKVKLLKRIRKTHFIKYDLLSKRYEIRYTIDNRGKYPISVQTEDVDIAFRWYRNEVLSSAYAIAKRGPRKKLIDVQHAVKPKL